MSLLSVSNRNLAGRPGRTAGLVVIVAALAFSLFTGAVLTESLEAGEQNVEDRLGADLMAVPLGSGYAEESILVNGIASTFYMDGSIEDSILGVSGVERVSSQIYMTSVSDADCCEFLVELIGYDPETDFTVSPWIAESYSSTVGDGQLVVGSNINVTDGAIRLFDHRFEVVSKLAESGTGMDNSVFMTKGTIGEMAGYARDLGFNVNADPDSQVSVVLVDVKDGYNEQQVSYRIQSLGADVVVSGDVTGEITMQMGSLIGYTEVFQITALILAVIVLATLFSIHAESRKREFAVLRMIGATRAGVAGSVLYESAVIGLAGALIGILLSAATVIPFSGAIGDALGLPYITSTSDLLPYAVLSFVVAFVIGPLSASFSAARLLRSDSYELFREGERWPPYRWRTPCSDTSAAGRGSMRSTACRWR